jgi:hypothetical protein
MSDLKPMTDAETDLDDLLINNCINCERPVSPDSDLFVGRQIATLNNDCLAPAGTHVWLCRDCVAEYRAWEAAQQT